MQIHGLKGFIMAEYYILIDKLTGTCKGHSSSNIYKPLSGEEVLKWSGAWPEFKAADSINSYPIQNKLCKWDGDKIRAKTIDELSAEKAASPLTIEERLAALEEILKTK